jgi:predicted nucleotidyltransferase
MLKAEQLTKILRRIAEIQKPEQIVLFGSYASGTATEDSDLDLLVVVNDHTLPRHRRAREIRKQLWGLADIPKDILVYTQSEIDEWKDVETAFITEALREGQVVYDKKRGIGPKLD